MPMRSTSVLQFERVWKVYRRMWPRPSVIALRGVTLSVPTGSLFALLGPNRAGKTTLAKIALSICRPTSGRVLRLGRPLVDRRTLGRIGYVHESPAFPPYLTATGLLHYYGALGQLPRTEVHQRTSQLLDDVGLSDRTHEAIASFSKGMLQRLALAQALLNDPELLILDEPAEGMDLVARHMLHRVLKDRQKRGKTALMVSHSLRDVERLCDEAAVICRGEVARNGSLEQLAGGDIAEALNLEEALEPLYSGAT
jgi:ABC-2 type transport system ATP-binding protein